LAIFLNYLSTFDIVQLPFAPTWNIRSGQ